MGNALGGMVFIVAGITLFYLVLTGRMQEILTGTSGTNPQTPSTPNTNTPPTGSIPKSYTIPGTTTLQVPM